MVLAMVAGTLGRVGLSWMCEGRVCSTGAAGCCCASVKERHDDCSVTSKEPAFASCEGGCGCQAVTIAPAGVQAIHGAKDSAAVPPSDVVPATLPPIFVAQSFALLETPQVRAIPPPDAPLSSVSTEHPCLRAPPIPLV